MQTIETQITAQVIDQSIAQMKSNDLVSSKGNVIGERFIFNLGDTKAMKAEIARQNPSWTKTKVSNHLSLARRDNLSASRLEAAAFVEMQYHKGNVAVSADHKDSGRSVLRFEKAEAVVSKVDEAAILKTAAAKLADKMGWTLEAAIEALK